MSLCLSLIVLISAPPADAKASLPPAEFGHGLTSQEALSGWISLFDGKTTFGWSNAKLTDGELSGGTTSGPFGGYELRVNVARGGVLTFAGQSRRVDAGPLQVLHSGRVAPIVLGEGLAIRTLAIRPLGLKSLFDGKDMGAWQRIDRQNIAADKRPVWKVEEGALRAIGGPGAVEHPGLFGDFVLQVDVRTRATYANGGVFFRSRPGDFMNGYEAQVYNRCEENDPGKPSTYSTGSLDDRQLARRLVSRDGETFRMTVIAAGPHIATWVNGHQLTDWTDTREKHDNPRQGLRLEPGTLQLQAHDPQTDVEFRGIHVAALE
jgi:hypothetical protein